MISFFLSDSDSFNMYMYIYIHVYMPVSSSNYIVMIFKKICLSLEELIEVRAKH